MEYTVTTPLEFYNTLDIINADNSGERNTIIVPNTIDFNGETSSLLLNTLTLLKGNGYRTSNLIFPINLQFQVNHDDFICQNLGVHGPHPDNTIPENDPTTGAFYVSGYNNTLFQGVELKHFSYYGVKYLNSRDNIIENSWIHHNRKSGLGYGAVLEGDSFLTARYNLMEMNRHCLAGSGELGQGYIAHNNIFGEPGSESASRLDMHGDGEVTGGTRIEIYDNKFTSTDGVDIGIRGVPTDVIKIYGNTFAHKCQKDAITQQQNNFQFGRLEFQKMEVYGNHYNHEACSLIGFDDSFLITDENGKAYQYEFNSDCYNHTKKKFIGNSFEVYDEIWANSWLSGVDEDIIVKTNTDQFLLHENISGGFIASRGVRIDDELSKYKLLKVGNVLGTQKNFIGQKNDNNLYDIAIASDGSITETLLLTNNIEFEDIVLGLYNDSSLQGVLGYESNGDSTFFSNNSGVLQAGVSLGNFPDHKFHGVGDFLAKGFDDIVSFDGSYIYLWRWNTGVLLNGAPTIRSGNGGDVYNQLIPVDYNGEKYLCAFKTNGDVQLLEYASSFKNPIEVGAVLNNARALKINIGNE